MEHKNITGANVHEPKGIEQSIAGEVYVSTVENENDGPFTGVWRKLTISDLDKTTYEVPVLTSENLPDAVVLKSNIVANLTGTMEVVSDVIGYNKNFQELFTLLENVDKRLQVVERNQMKLLDTTKVIRDSLVAIELLKEPSNA